jgi:hypothetical protein
MTREEDLTTPDEERPPRDDEPSEEQQEGADPVNVERVGGTADTNPWHDHKVMLVSPDIAEIIDFYRDSGRRPHLLVAARKFIAAFHTAPAVFADDDAIRWFTNRQAPGENHDAR